MKLTRTIPFAVVSLFCALAFVACGDSEATGPDCGGTDCGGVCVDTNNDPANCGACGNACASGEVCSAGSCGSSCGTGSTACGGSCVDTNANPNHCGACDAACAAGEVCNAGACAASCGGGTTDCSGACVDTMVDPANCGGCGTACGAGEVCTAGACTPTCAAPNVLCEGKCIDPMTDPNYCGATGACTGLSAGSVCSAGEVCDGTGNCGVVCAASRVSCGGSCIDPDTDNTYCGASGDCMNANAGTTCQAGFKCDGTGNCALSCDSTRVECNGACIDPATDRTYCGASGDCMNANSGTTCGLDEICESSLCTLTPIVYSDNFTGGVNATAQQCTDWQNYRDSLTGEYVAVHFFGSQNPTGYSCTDPAMAQQIADGLRDDVQFFLTCDGNNWARCDNYDGQFWVGPGPPNSACDGSNCSSGAMFRPCITIGTGFWGGIDTSFCSNSVTQSINIVFDRE